VDLAGKGALITGARRIGRVVAEELARSGVDVALSYARSHDEAQAAAARVRDHGRHAIVLQADLSDPAACRALIAGAARALGRLDILVNMASVYVRRSFDDLTPADWEAPMTVDLRASFLCAQAAVPHMRAAGGGRIVNFTDWTVRSGRPRYRGYLPYYVAKGGVIALTEALALELAADNILVNSVAPGPILPPAGTSTEEVQRVEEATPVGRWGGEIEIAKAVKALLESDFITGATITVDGGRHLK
jgi:NAD(P)-dependent dehydrogenase (short-subunit alcohol dehydrogenase family)